MTHQFEPELILRTLVRHAVDFVVIGALAAYLQGSPLPTLDVDITPDPDLGNLGRLSDALTELEAKIRSASVDPLAFSHTARSLSSVNVWNLTTRYGDLDISLVPSGTQGFADLRRDAFDIDIGGVSVLLASLADIIRSKEAAGRDKDRRALPVLREILARRQP